MAALFLGLFFKYTLFKSPDSKLALFVMFFNKLLKAMGKIYFNLLLMTVFPIIISSIVSSLAGLLKSKIFSQFILRFLLMFFIFLLLTGIIGITFGFAFNPGQGLDQKSINTLGEKIQQQPDENIISLSDPVKTPQKKFFLDYLLTIIPKNIFHALKFDKKLQVILFSIILGIACGLLKDKNSQYMLNLFNAVTAAFQLIINWLLFLLPLGIIFLLTPQVTELGFEIILTMLRFIIVFLLASCFLLILNTYIIYKRSNKPLSYVIKSLINPILVSLLTRNSFMALPAAISVMDKKFNFYERICKLFLPFGISVGRFGNILYFSLAAIFVAQLYGINLIFSHFSIIFITSILAGITSAGTTGPASLVMLPIVLSPIGLPAQAVIIIFIAIDAFVDPVRTLLNVQTNMAVTSIVAEKTGRGDRRKQDIVLKPLLSVRASIIFLLSFLILLTGLTTALISYNGSKHSVYLIAEKMINEISEKVSDKVKNYMQPAERIIAQMQILFRNKAIDYNQTDSFLDYLKNVLIKNHEINSIYMGFPNGSFAMTKRMPDSSFSYRIISRNNGKVNIKWVHENNAFQEQFPSEILDSEKGYDPRKRGWYKLATENNELIWQDVYFFASDGIPGVTCAVAIYNEQKEFIGVLGVDIGVMEYSYFLGELDVSETGKTILLNNKDELIAVSMKRQEITELNIIGKLMAIDKKTNKPGLILIEDIEDELIRNSYFSFQTQKSQGGLPVYRINNKKILISFKRFFPNEYFKWSIGILISEKTIMGSVNQYNLIVLILSFVFIIISLLLGFWFSKSISLPLSHLSKEMEGIQRFELDDIKPVNSLLKEVQDMNNSFQNMTTGLRSFKKYVPANLVSKLIRLGQEAEIGGEKRKLTLFFSDIKDFTTISEIMDVEKLVEKLVAYFSRLSKVIINNQGTVDKFMGDAIMAFWGAPEKIENHAILACQSALECQKLVTKMLVNNEFSDESNKSCRFFTRIGINTGEVIVGNMGSEERLNYTVIGDNVNLASRLEGLNKIYNTNIIISESTYEEVKTHMAVRLLDKVAVKGRQKGILIYELIAEKENLADSMKNFVKTSDQGVYYYLDKQWDKAIAIFEKILKIKSNDEPANILKNRCLEFKAKPPDSQWDGVFVYDQK